MACFRVETQIIGSSQTDLQKNSTGTQQLWRLKTKKNIGSQNRQQGQLNPGKDLLVHGLLHVEPMKSKPQHAQPGADIVWLFCIFKPFKTFKPFKARTAAKSVKNCWDIEVQWLCQCWMFFISNSLYFNHYCAGEVHICWENSIWKAWKVLLGSNRLMFKKFKSHPALCHTKMTLC